MYYYFSSNYPSALKINGVYYGILGDALKPLRVDEGFTPFIELCPIGDGQTLNLILDKNFLSSPPRQVVLTDLKGGFLIKFCSFSFSPDFFIVNQQKFNDAIVTVFNENGLKLSIETHNDFYAETFKFDCENAEILEFYQNNFKFIVICFLGKNKILCVYKITDKIEKVFMREVSEFSLDDSFTTVEKRTDIAKHTINSCWEFDGNAFKQKNIEIKVKDGFNFIDLPEKLIPYAFLESFLIGEDIDCYLCDDMKNNKAFLNGFFGDFIGIMPPPKFRAFDEIGLIYQELENKYSVKYFSFQVENRKIINLKQNDD